MKVTREQLIEMIKHNQDVSNVDTSDITDMSHLFENNKTFNQDISKWDVSNVTNMSFMFYSSIFNGDISKWNVSNVINMSGMFYNSIFNGDISKWNVSNVINMSGMFYNSIFNGDISKWNVSNVIDMSYMFAFSYFNQSLKNWNPIFLEKATGMFLNSYCFNQSILFLQNKKLYNIDYILKYATSYNKDIYLTINEKIEHIDIYQCFSCFSDIKNVYPLIYKKKINFNIFHKDMNFIKNNIFLDE